MPLLAGVRATIERHHLAGPQTRVLAAVSGGADSVALLYLLIDLAAAGALRLVGVAHFNHQLRAESDADERYCAALSEAAGLEFLSDGADVAALARAERRSLEVAARTARHAFFARAVVAAGADVVALGHTRDDQAETFLLRMLRGAGPRGLAAMHPRSGLAIRPLLECRRHALRAYLDDRGVAWRHDASNDDLTIPRNRVRAELLPWLAARFNPSIVDVLADEASIQQEQHAHVARAASAWLHQWAEVSPAVTTLDARAIVAAPTAVARAALRQAMSVVAGPRAIGFKDVEHVLALALQDGPCFDAPGMRVERIGPRVVLTGRPSGHHGRWTDPPALGFDHTLPVPGEVQVAETGVTVSAEVASGWAGEAADGTVAAVQARLGGSFRVRSRRPGDRFRPFGLNGHKKLQDFFVDRKVDRAVRDEVPLVVDEADRIVWVAGHAIDHEFRVKNPAQSVIILRLKGLGGSV